MYIKTLQIRGSRPLQLDANAPTRHTARAEQTGGAHPQMSQVHPWTPNAEDIFRTEARALLSELQGVLQQPDTATDDEKQEIRDFLDEFLLPIFDFPVDGDHFVMHRNVLNDAYDLAVRFRKKGV